MWMLFYFMVCTVLYTLCDWLLYGPMVVYKRTIIAIIWQSNEQAANIFTAHTHTGGKAKEKKKNEEEVGRELCTRTTMRWWWRRRRRTAITKTKTKTISFLTHLVGVKFSIRMVWLAIKKNLKQLQHDSNNKHNEGRRKRIKQEGKDERKHFAFAEEKKITQKSWQMMCTRYG